MVIGRLDFSAKIVYDWQSSLRDFQDSLGRGLMIMIKIAVDAMGGDRAPEEIVKGSLGALAGLPGLEILLVGQEEKIRQVLAGLEDYPGNRLSIIPAREVIGSDEQPGLSIRKKKDSSLAVAMNLVKNGEAEAVVSAGNTGALVAAGLFITGRLEGISRPALAPFLPSLRGEDFMLLDVGAYVDARPENLQQYGLMGSIYARVLLDKPAPRVALLNIGTEPSKGNQLTREAYSLLEKAPINFAGNVEARDIMEGVADVVVCDGFVGNIVLKLLEGTVSFFLQTFKEEVNLNTRTRAGAFLLLPAMKSIKKKFDYKEYGGALLLGVNGICIKSHGSSDEKNIKNAIINQAYPLAEEKVNRLIRQEIQGCQL